VLKKLTNVPTVCHQESMLQTVLVQMVSMITVTLVSVVPTTVLLVTTEMFVLLVLSTELMLQLVNVHPDSMILVKLNVNNVELNVWLVTETISVLHVTTQV
jgi:hypothetical protein